MACADVAPIPRVRSPTDEHIADKMFKRGLSPDVLREMHAHAKMNRGHAFDAFVKIDIADDTKVGAIYAILRQQFPRVDDELVRHLVYDKGYSLVWARECLATGTLVRPRARYTPLSLIFDDEEDDSD